ncbi:uncharacterized protein LOC116348760 [Contarinia nasturtii]|uniref:uncharacterized protein LOC116348760 n=1 Tax=Contarinia nasturtii TaxID=265458 RepID=UPI0012D49ABE|nr:uncharacterized protein LOC116348760 [Contarinia nasturtii]
MSFDSIVLSTFIVLLSCTCNGSPPRDSRDINNQEIVGQATNIITSKLLKGGIENHKNSVFSPFGYATILTILEEGAHDDTSYDIRTMLKHPNDRALVRSAYRSVLSHLQGLDPDVAPQFRTWFYIYKNNTADESFKETITKEFYVTVRDVEPIDEQQMDEQPTPPIAKSVEEVKSTIVQVKPEGKPTNSKDILQFDSYKMESPVDETRIDNQKDASKFDEVVEDRQYVEAPAIRNKLQQEKAKFEKEQQEKNRPEKVEQAKKQQSKNLGESKASESLKEHHETIGTEKSSLPTKQYEEMEIMQAEESRSGKAFAGKYGEGASIISGNSIVGEKEDYKEGDAYQFEPKMLLFNGLYYHGSWAIPFQHLRDAEIENIFYAVDGEKIQIKMMKGRGYFRTGKISKYNCEAIELPYDNIRYSMLVVMPQEGPGGLEKFISEFNANGLNEISSGLKEELINVGLPKFEVQTTGGAEKVLAKEGLASMFTSKANFSGISKSQKLRIGELQQHVILSVDETSSSENSLTAVNALRSREPANQRSIVINRPFFFFIRDRLDDVTIIAGKITTLEAFANDEPEIPRS